MRFSTLLPAIGLLAAACAGEDDTGETGIIDTPPPGCIAVEGGQPDGYEFLSDALEAAEGGALVTLCEDQLIDETVFIDGFVVSDVLNIQGVEGAPAQIVPAVNMPAVRITETGDLTIKNVAITTTRSAFVVEAGGSLDLSDSTLDAVPNYGVDVKPGATAVIDGVTMTAPAWGGVKVDSGTLTMSNTTITDPGAYGVYVENDGTATITDSVISGALHNDTSNSLWDIDGVGVWLETGASATLSGNQIVNSDIANISADDAVSLTMDGDIVGGGYAGMTIRNTALDMSNVLVDSYFQYGIICLDCPDATLHSTVVQTVPGSAPYDNVPPDTSNGSIGLFGIEADIVVTGTPEAPSQFSGNNQAGILVQPGGGGDTALLDISNAEILDNAALGMSIVQGELTMTDSVVRGSRRDDVNCITDSGYQCNMGLALWTSNATLTNSGVQDSEDWGLTVVAGVVDVVGGTFSGNETYGVFTQSASINVDGTTFDGGRRASVYMNQNSSGVIDNATFQNANYETSFEYTSGEDLIRSVTYYQADDVLLYDSELFIQNTTFQDGENGITGYGFNGEASVTIQDSTFSRYNSDPIFSGTGSRFTVDRVTIDETGQRAVYCSSGTVSMDKVQINNTTKYKYKNEQYRNGEFERETNFENPGQAVYGYQCDYTFEDVAINGTDGQAMYLDSSALEIDGMTVANPYRDSAGTAAMQLSWRETGTDKGYPSAYINDLAVSGVNDVDALRISGWADSSTGDLAVGTVSITGLAISANQEATTGGDGVDSIDIGNLSITGLEIDDAKQAGVRLTRTNASITGASGSSSGAIEGAGEAGIYIDASRTPYADAAVTLTDVTVSNSAGDGIYVSSGTHTFSGVTVSSAGDYGAECVDATFDACDASLEGASGAHLGCDACVE